MRPRGGRTQGNEKSRSITTRWESNPSRMSPVKEFGARGVYSDPMQTTRLGARQLTRLHLARADAAVFEALRRTPRSGTPYR